MNNSRSSGYLTGPALLGASIGAFISFLFRPAAPLVGQLPFGIVITRGASLKGLDSILVPYAESSFNIMIVGMILGGIIGMVIGSLLSKTSRASSVPDFDPAESKNCPRCAETIKFEAKACKYCGYEFSEEELKRQIEEREQLLRQDEYAFKKLPEYTLLQVAYDFQHNQDNFFKAKYYLERLLREYPKGEYNEVAKERLAEIKKGRPNLFRQRDEIKAVRSSSSGQPNQGTMLTFGVGTSPAPSKPDEPATGVPSGLTCPRCQEALSAMARFCSNCGAEVEQTQVSDSLPSCPQCGRAVNPGARFCGGCGYRLEDAGEVKR